MTRGSGSVPADAGARDQPSVTLPHTRVVVLQR